MHNSKIIPAPLKSECDIADRIYQKIIKSVSTGKLSLQIQPCVDALKLAFEETFAALKSHDPKHPSYLAPAQRAYASGKQDVFQGYKKLFDETGKLYELLFNAWNQVSKLVVQRKIDPKIEFRVSTGGKRSFPKNLNRPARVIFYATKFDPVQLVHLLVIPYLIAKYKADKVVVMNDNSDPRKPNLSTLAIREPVAKNVLKMFGPFVQYLALQKERADLFDADGETVLREFMVANREIPLDVIYVAGLDHMKLMTVNKSGEKVKDTPLKIKDFLDARSNYGFHADTEVNLAFIHRPGVTGTDDPKVIKKHSGIDVDVIDFGVETNVSATMVREEGRFWMTLPMIQKIAEEFGIWGYGTDPAFVAKQNAVGIKLAEILNDSRRKKSELNAKLAVARGRALHLTDGIIVSRLLKAEKALNDNPYCKCAKTLKDEYSAVRELLFNHSEKLVKKALK